MDKPKKQRADVALVERGLAESREKAQALIMAGLVYIAEEKVLKPSEAVKADDDLTIRGAAHPYVSRSGLKLEKALRVFNYDPAGVVAMDLGASTGGFTDVLLRNGAAHVYAVDVGFGQLDWRIRGDARVTVMERTNARSITADMFDPVPTLGVMDVSFISIRLILPAAFEILGSSGRFISLIKPQFEAGRERVGKKGVVSDPETHADVVESIVRFVPSLGWKTRAVDFSPITGPEGNIEFLADFLPAEKVEGEITRGDIEAMVKAAHEAHRK
ncbi:MAG: TlyA family RNA methyltransferase [Clostridia bacterium]|nr:TlyA family RNA methyltransferase [Clostridia bacterium]